MDGGGGGIDGGAGGVGAVEEDGRAEGDGDALGVEEGFEQVEVSHGAFNAGGVDGDIGFDGDQSDAGLEGLEVGGWGDAAFGEDSEGMAGGEVSEGGAGGGKVAAGAVDGDGADALEEPSAEGLVVVLAGHHPGDEVRAGGLQDDGVEATDVVADEDSGASEGDGAGVGDGDVMEAAEVVFKDTPGGANEGAMVKGREWGDVGHGERDMKGSGKSQREVRRRKVDERSGGAGDWVQYSDVHG